MPAIPITCPSCSTTGAVPESYRGKRIRCTTCGQKILVPAAELAGPGPAAADPSPLHLPAVVKRDLPTAPPAAHQPVYHVEIVPPPEMLPEPGVVEIKDCPACGEQILAVAKKCKHCGEVLDASYEAVTRVQPTTKGRRRARRKKQGVNIVINNSSNATANAVAGASVGMGFRLSLAALLLGIFALMLAWIPCLGLFTLPVSGIGLLLAVIAMCSRRDREDEGPGLAVAAAAVNGLAIVVVGAWLVLGAGAFAR